MLVWYVSDGKAGHASQAKGLEKYLQQIEQIDFQTLSTKELNIAKLFWGLWIKKARPSYSEASPSLIIGVGRRTHLKVWLLGQIYKMAKTVLIMRPALPAHWFDLVLLPPHDASKNKALSSNTLISPGVLNPLINEGRHQQGYVLILVGGKSKRYEWSNDKVWQQINHRLKQTTSISKVVLTTSRRTPDDFLLNKDFIDSKIDIFPMQETTPAWLNEQFQLADEVWVTEDSLSMIYEAANSGAKVYLLKLMPTKQDRIIKYMNELSSLSFNVEQKEHFKKQLIDKLGLLKRVKL